MQILRALPEQAALLTEIALTAKQFWGYPPDWLELWKKELTITPQFILDHDTYIASADAVLGFYSLVSANHALRLEHLWVRPAEMRKGIGRALFRHAITRAKALGAPGIEIVSDPNAAGFYERLGAEKVGAVKSEMNGLSRELPIFRYPLEEL